MSSQICTINIIVWFNINSRPIIKIYTIWVDILEFDTFIDEQTICS